MHRYNTPAVDCISLKKALLNAKIEDGFLCLSENEKFPVGLRQCTDPIPLKLMIRSFHKEIKLIIQKLRDDERTGGAIFFGPAGTGKSWTAQAVLVDELKDAQVSGKTVVFFYSVGKCALVFSKQRNVEIKVISKPNVVDIPELEDKNTVLIYDSMGGERKSTTCFPCQCLIFSGPSTGNIKNMAGIHGIYRFICPNWTLDELKLLAHGYGDRVSPTDVESRYNSFGGIPRAVVVNATSISEWTQETDVRIMSRGGVHLWSEWSELCTSDWSGSLLKAKYNTEDTAVTPEDAFNKYWEGNVTWDYSCTNAMNLVHSKYDIAPETTRAAFQHWLQYEWKAGAFYRAWFDYRVRTLFQTETDDKDVEIKILIVIIMKRD